jgi:hypothetical protein
MPAAGPWEDASPLLPYANLGNVTIITGDSSGVSADTQDRMPVVPPASTPPWL